VTRLRRSSPQSPGWRRIRSGRGFRYVDQAGDPLRAADADRVRALVIPPAWTDVWVCPDELGHLQAVGTDDAGRRQYLYHPAWREKQDVAKFDRVLTMARKLPGVRKKLAADLRQRKDVRRRVLAAGVRLVDLGCFRLGADSYADENGSHGLTTLERRHLRRDTGGYVFRFVGKAGIEHEVRIEDRAVCRAVEDLTKGRRASARFLAAKVDGSWRAISAGELNDYIRELFGTEVTAKDFRTWHATVAVAVALASEPRAASPSGRKRQVRAAIAEAADLLGNTPAVARSSYVHPRVIDLFEAGETLARVPPTQNAADRAVVRLLTR
jgi:DNA topoisomerase-1